MFTDHLAVIYGLEVEAIALLHIDVEMIAPELDHELVELALAVNLPDKCCLAEFIRNRLTVVVVEETVTDGFQLIGVHVQRLEGLEPKIAVEIVDGLKGKLFLDPGLQSDFHETGAFFHAWTEGETVQHQEVARIQRSPRDSGEVACQLTIYGGTGGERRTGGDKGGEFEEVASG